MQLLLVTVLASVILFAGCGGYGQPAFHVVSENSVGTEFSEYRYEAIRGPETSEDGNLVYFYSKGDVGCEWAVEVDAETENIVKWWYVSDAELCLAPIDWFGVW